MQHPHFRPNGPTVPGELLARWADTVRTDLAPQGVALGWANGSAFGRKTSRLQSVDCDIY
jgi:hypothetical protein